MKLGLVVEGGAARAYYSCGIMDELLRNDIYADYVIGTSAGIANAVSYVSKQIGRNYKIGTTYVRDKRYYGLSHWLNRKNRSFFNLNFVFGEIPNRLLPFDYEAFAAYKGEVIATVTNVETGKPEYLPVSRYDRKFSALRATCALPIMFKTIKIDGKKYLDGGIADSIPFERAFKDGCDKCIIILTQARDYKKTLDRTLKLSAGIYRRHPDFRRALLGRPAMYNAQLEKIREYEKQGRVYVIAPKSSLGISRTERDPKKIDRIYRLGEADMRENLDGLKEFLAK